MPVFHADGRFELPELELELELGLELLRKYLALCTGLRYASSRTIGHCSRCCIVEEGASWTGPAFGWTD